MILIINLLNNNAVSTLISNFNDEKYQKNKNQKS
jgi:hypothetical protein